MAIFKSFLLVYERVGTSISTRTRNSTGLYHVETRKMSRNSPCRTIDTGEVLVSLHSYSSSIRDPQSASCSCKILQGPLNWLFDPCPSLRCSMHDIFTSASSYTEGQPGRKTNTGKILPIISGRYLGSFVFWGLFW